MENYIGEICLFAGNFAPRGWAFCQGQLLRISNNYSLHSILNTTYGGDGRTTFALPDLRGRIPMHPGSSPELVIRRGDKGGSEKVRLTEANLPVHNHKASLYAENAIADQKNPKDKMLGATPIYASGTDGNPRAMGNESIQIETSGESQAHDNMQPFVVSNYIICMQGIYPSKSRPYKYETIIGDIILFAGDFAPAEYVFCEGQRLGIDSNRELFDIIGNTYGGDGVTSFNLPDLRGRTAIHEGNGPQLTPRPLGQKGGASTQQLKLSEMPEHTHSGTLYAGNAKASEASPEGNMLAATPDNPAYAALTTGNNKVLDTGSILVEDSGENKSHANTQPYSGINYIICVKGRKPYYS